MMEGTRKWKDFWCDKGWMGTGKGLKGDEGVEMNMHYAEEYNRNFV